MQYSSALNPGDERGPGWSVIKNNRINDIQQKQGLASVPGGSEVEPAATVDEAVEIIRRYEGRAEDFALPIADALIDPVGANMAVITDAILAKGFEPAGFEQKNGYRLYSVTPLE